MTKKKARYADNKAHDEAVQAAKDMIDAALKKASDDYMAALKKATDQPKER